jgi:hypothetical protein
MRSLINLYNILDLIEKDREMFLGKNCMFHSLKTFIHGFTITAKESQLQSRNWPSLELFDCWVIGHLGKKVDPSLRWHEQILKRNHDNDEKAFEDFFHLLKIFRQSKITIKTLYLDTEARIKYMPELNYGGSSLEERHLIENVCILRWTQLSTSTCVWIDELDTNYDVFSERWYLTESEANEVMKVEFGNIENAWEEQEFRAPKL